MNFVGGTRARRGKKKRNRGVASTGTRESSCFDLLRRNSPSRKCREPCANANFSLLPLLPAQTPSATRVHALRLEHLPPWQDLERARARREARLLGGLVRAVRCAPTHQQVPTHPEAHAPRRQGDLGPAATPVHRLKNRRRGRRRGRRQPRPPRRQYRSPPRRRLQEICRTKAGGSPSATGWAPVI